MVDQLVPLLRWVAAQDPLSEIVLQCPDANPVRATSHSVVVVWDECVSSMSLGAIAQLVAVGATYITVQPCHAHRTEIVERIEVWNLITPGKVALYEPAKKRMLPALRKGEKLYLGNIPMPRRALLGLRIDSPVEYAADDQERTMQALEFLGIDSLEMIPVQSPQGISLRADGCTMCAVCVRACPHDALSISGDGDKRTLSHNVSRCRGCRRCESLCPVGALSDNGPASWSDAASRKDFALASILTRKCAACGSIIEASSGDMCALCSYRKDHPFESVPMEVMKSLVERSAHH